MDPFETHTTDLEQEDDIALADRMRAGREQILTEIHKRIIGQREVINETLLTLFVGGNSLIIGVPGLAKTLLIQTMAQVLDLKFGRIQFTPDLMPSDITGTDIIQEDAATGGRKMVFAPGPVFTNILLADEINRTPPKTQSALLEGDAGAPGGRSRGAPTPWRSRSSSSPPRTRSSSRAPTRSRRRSSTASCFSSSSSIRPRRRSWRSCGRRPGWWSPSTGTRSPARTWSSSSGSCARCRCRRRSCGTP